MPRLFLLFVIVPLLELALLIQVGGMIGTLATVAIILVTAALGASLARHQGLATLARFQERLSAGELPHEEILDGVAILIAAALLLTPGFLTDATGFALLVPWIRRRLGRRIVSGLRHRMEVHHSAHGFRATFRSGGGEWPPGEEVRETEVRVLEEEEDGNEGAERDPPARP